MTQKTATKVILTIIGFTALSLKADPNLELHRAVKQGNIKAIQTALETGANVNGKGKFDQTALLIAAEGGKTDIARLLIQKGADVNAKNDRDETVLMAAVTSGKIDLTRLLLTKGTKVNAQEENGANAGCF